MHYLAPSGGMPLPPPGPLQVSAIIGLVHGVSGTDHGAALETFDRLCREDFGGVAVRRLWFLEVDPSLGIPSLEHVESIPNVIGSSKVRSYLQVSSNLVMPESLPSCRR